MSFDIKFMRRDQKTCRNGKALNGKALTSHSTFSDQA